jgi:hypothetical protein
VNSKEHRIKWIHVKYVTMHTIPIPNIFTYHTGCRATTYSSSKQFDRLLGSLFSIVDDMREIKCIYLVKVQISCFQNDLK